jgi:ribosome-binding ATPase YchF (GTP1/OBG family)
MGERDVLACAKTHFPYSSMCFPAQWAVIDELDFMKQEIPRWNEVLRRETEARRAVSCRQTEGNRTKTPCIYVITHTWSHARMHAHSEVLVERWRDGYRKRGPRGTACLYACSTQQLKYTNACKHTQMHANTRKCMQTHAQCEVQLAQLREAVHQKNQQIMELQSQHEEDANLILALYKEVCLGVLACKCMYACVNLRVCQCNRCAGCGKMFHLGRVFCL